MLRNDYLLGWCYGVVHRCPERPPPYSGSPAGARGEDRRGENGWCHTVVDRVTDGSRSYCQEVAESRCEGRCHETRKSRVDRMSAPKANSRYCTTHVDCHREQSPSTGWCNPTFQSRPQRSHCRHRWTTQVPSFTRCAPGKRELEKKIAETLLRNSLCLPTKRFKNLCCTQF